MGSASVFGIRGKFGVTAGLLQCNLRFFIEHVAHAFVKQQRENELLVIAGINRPAQKRGCAPKIPSV
jgi:hypothetical protein